MICVLKRCEDNTGRKLYFYDDTEVASMRISSQPSSVQYCTSSGRYFAVICRKARHEGDISKAAFPPSPLKDTSCSLASCRNRFYSRSLRKFVSCLDGSPS